MIDLLTSRNVVHAVEVRSCDIGAGVMMEARSWC